MMQKNCPCPRVRKASTATNGPVVSIIGNLLDGFIVLRYVNKAGLSHSCCRRHKGFLEQCKMPFTAVSDGWQQISLKLEVQDSHPFYLTGWNHDRTELTTP